MPILRARLTGARITSGPCGGQQNLTLALQTRILYKGGRGAAPGAPARLLGIRTPAVEIAIYLIVAFLLLFALRIPEHGPDDAVRADLA